MLKGYTISRMLFHAWEMLFRSNELRASVVIGDEKGGIAGLLRMDNSADSLLAKAVALSVNAVCDETEDKKEDGLYCSCDLIFALKNRKAGNLKATICITGLSTKENLAEKIENVVRTTCRECSDLEGGKFGIPLKG